MKNALKTKGTTITELIVVMLLISILLILSYYIFNFSNRIFLQELNNSVDDQEFMLVFKDLGEKYFECDSVLLESNQLIFKGFTKSDSMIVESNAIPYYALKCDSINFALIDTISNRKISIAFTFYKNDSSYRLRLP